MPWISSSAIMETASMQLQSVTTTMIVQTSVMSLDAVCYTHNESYLCTSFLACNTVCNYN